MELFRSQNGTAIGIFASATANQSVALGYQLQATKEYTVSLGNDFIKRQITNMAAGTEDTDGVNVLQLKGANAEILIEANNYTDNKTAEIVTTVNNYTDQKAAETLNSANNYTDQKADETLTSANNYTNQKTSETLTSANDYTKSQVAQKATARQEGDRKTLQKANDYTDSKLSGLGNKVTNLDKRIDRNRKTGRYRHFRRNGHDGDSNGGRKTAELRYGDGGLSRSGRCRCRFQITHQRIVGGKN